MGPVAFWRAAWTAAVEENPRWRDAETDEAFWSDYAPAYDERSPLAACATDLISDMRALLPKGGTLLDIGAGTGAFTRRLATGLSAVTCVEPSAAMRRAFASTWDHPLDVNCIPTDWLTAPDGLTADLVLCANALYRTESIDEALRKMIRAARCRVAIVQSVGRPYAGPLQLLEGDKLWERERADALCDVLSVLGLQHQRQDYSVARPDGESQVALIVWKGDAVGRGASGADSVIEAP